MYDVQAYPKSVSNPQKHTQIQVTKRIYNVDENDNVIPLETKEDVTYNVGLYLDPDGRCPLRDDYAENPYPECFQWYSYMDGCSGWHLLCI
ncbi:MAG: hypothetical protein V8Q67_03575 [Blautia massiliensis (ex Durand et al. 2017)]